MHVISRDSRFIKKKCMQMSVKLLNFVTSHKLKFLVIINDIFIELKIYSKNQLSNFKKVCCYHTHFMIFFFLKKKRGVKKCVYAIFFERRKKKLGKRWK
jgi:hypothetical protein